MPSLIGCRVLLRPQATCACLWIAAISAAASAQTLTAPEAGVKCITHEDATILKECVDATPPQCDAIDRLTDGAVHSLLEVSYDAQRAERTRQLRRERGTAQQQQKSEQDGYEKVERQWLDDTHALITDAQADGWLRFERARRRVLLHRLYYTARIDLTAAVQSLRIDEDDNPQLKAVLLSWEAETDAHVKDWLAIRADLAKYNTPEGQKAAQASSQLKLAMGQTNIRAFRSLLEFLTPQQQSLLRRARLRSYASGLSPVLTQAAVVREVLSIPDLSPARKDQIRAVAQQHQQQVTTIAEQFLKDADDLVLAGSEDHALQGMTEAAMAKVDSVEAGLEDAVLGLLTIGEREAYRRVPPVPYEWRGNDEDGWRWGNPQDRND